MKNMTFHRIAQKGVGSGRQSTGELRTKDAGRFCRNLLYRSTDFTVVLSSLISNDLRKINRSFLLSNVVKV
jgi:hypothetical protein